MAVLKATNGTAITSALLSLADPHYNAATGELTFQVRPIWQAGRPCAAAYPQVYQDCAAQPSAAQLWQPQGHLLLDFGVHSLGCIALRFLVGYL